MVPSVKAVTRVACSVFLLAAFAVATAPVRQRQLLHQRDVLPAGWVDKGSAKPLQPVSFWLALHQRNRPELERVLYAVSDPKSPEWRKHWSIERIQNLVAPKKKDVEKVHEWLRSTARTTGLQHGVDGAKLLRFRSFRDSVEVHTVAAVAEALFHTNMRLFLKAKVVNTNSATEIDAGTRVVKAFGAVTVPHSLASIVQMVTVLSDFPFKTSKAIFTPVDAASPDVLQNNNYVTPAQTKMVNKIPATEKVASANATQGVVEFGLVIPHETGQDGGGGGGFQFSDLQLFANQTSTPFINVSRIVGPFKQLNLSGTAESLLDVEYLSHVGVGSPTAYSTYLVWMYEFAVKLFNDPNAPLVNSISYGTGEFLMCNKTLNGAPNPECHILGVDPAGYLERANTEFAKLGARGITLVSASGDNGAPSENNKFCQKDDSEYPLFPVFPASSPYVLAVGGIAIITQHTGASGPQPVMCQRSLGYCAGPPYTLQASMVTNGGITTGGGFSNYTARPAYQDSAVKAFLASGAFKPPASKFKSGNRAYPDVSNLASQILIMQNGLVLKGAGTSASTPMIAGIVSLINGRLMSAGENPLGWVNPLVYQMAEADPSTFIDVVSGNNTCTEAACCKYGYGTATGWDPVTGWGTPNYPNVVAYIDQLVAAAHQRK